MEERRPCILHPERPGIWLRATDKIWLCGFCHDRMGTLPLALSDLPEPVRQRVPAITFNVLSHMASAGRCCPRCCQGCANLADLVLENQVDIWVASQAQRAAPLWWDPQQQRVHRDFIIRTWADSHLRGCHRDG
jgi:hypothetical protein